MSPGPQPLNNLNFAEHVAMAIHGYEYFALLQHVTFSSARLRGQKRVRFRQSEHEIMLKRAIAT